MPWFSRFEFSLEAFLAYENLNSVIQSETIEILMKLQLVLEQQQGENVQDLMLEEQDQEELVYAAPSEQSIGSQMLNAGDQGAPKTNSAEKKKMNWQAGPANDSQKMNRADRRRLEKKK
jgi:hypothetical protein